MKKEFGEEATNVMESVEKAISNMSNSCCKCNASFDKNDQSQLDSWRVTINQEGFNLICPNCTINEE